MYAAHFVLSLLADNLSFRTALVLSVVLTATLLYFRKPRNQLPGPLGWPIVGNIVSLAKGHRPVTITEWAQRYGPVYQMRLGQRKFVVLSGYEVIYEALVRRAEDFSGRPFSMIHRILNPKREGILTADFGPAWKEHRKFTLMTLRQFGFGKRSLEGKILEESTALQAEIMKIGDRPFDIRLMLQNAVTNVICSIVFGTRWEYNDKKFTRLMDIIDGVASFNLASQLAFIFPVLRVVPGFGRGIQTLRIVGYNVNGYVKEEVDSHKNTFDPNDIRDLVDSYIKEIKSRSRENDNGTTFTEEYAQMVILDLFFAGAETTSTTLYWSFLYMILNQDVQRKVQKEIHSVLGHDKPPSTAHRAQMPYTEAVLTEVSRIATIIPDPPHATSRDTTLHGYHIPEGVTVIPNLWSVHHDPERFPHPDKFDPGRFLDAQEQYQRDDHVIPFSLGPRGCLGKQLAEMELFLFFTFMLQHFTFKLPEGVDRPSTIGVHGVTNSPKKFELVAEPLA